MVKDTLTNLYTRQITKKALTNQNAIKDWTELMKIQKRQTYTSIILWTTRQWGQLSILRSWYSLEELQSNFSTSPPTVIKIETHKKKRMVFYSPSAASAGCKLFNIFIMRSYKTKSNKNISGHYTWALKEEMWNSTLNNSTPQRPFFLYLLDWCLLEKILKMRHKKWCR